MISHKIFLGNGTTSRFLSDFIIRSEQFARPYVFIYDNTLPSDGSGDKLVDGTTDPLNWSYPTNVWKRGANVAQSGDVVSIDKWDVIDNGIFFYTPPLSGSTVWLEVATTSEEFGTTLILPTLDRAETAADSASTSAGEASASASAAGISAGEAADSAASVSASSAQIETNRLDIITNTANISTNASDISTKVSKAGDTITGQLKGITPVSAEDLTRKDYVDTAISTSIASENLASGTYTPTLNNFTNISSVTSVNGRYTRIGNVASISGQIWVTLTTTGSALLDISLPIPTTFSLPTNGSGVGVGIGVGGLSAADIKASTATGNTAIVSILSGTSTSVVLKYDFTYEII